MISCHHSDTNKQAEHHTTLDRRNKTISGKKNSQDRWNKTVLGQKTHWTGGPELGRRGPEDETVGLDDRERPIVFHRVVVGTARYQVLSNANTAVCTKSTKSTCKQMF